MPWKEDHNPYYIWLSEIILQQTRVEQGMPYFLKFKKLFPSVRDLAKASPDEVLKAWQGLGYYARARNLHFTAQYILAHFDGVFPNKYEDIIQLKGIGPYTAAAICSFAYGMPYAVVDGNVYRVLSRFFGIKTPIDSTDGKKEFALLAQQLIDVMRPGDYNQAIMDFGATHCTPSGAGCSDCPLRSRCVAYATNAVNEFPVKVKKIKKRIRYFQFLIIEHAGSVSWQRREGKDIWKGLYQFPMIETKRAHEVPDFFSDNDLHWKYIISAHPLVTLKQTLTHQEINAVFWKVVLEDSAYSLLPFDTIDVQNISNFAVPKIIDLFLFQTKGIFVKK